MTTLAPSGLPLDELREGCQKCGLYKTCQSPLMAGRGKRNRPLVAIVGEAPGADEDISGEPFVGRSGQLINSLIRDMEIETEFFATNAVRCRPPNNEIKDTPINCCRSFLTDELLQVKPKVIIAVGNSPLFSLLGRRGIGSDRGKIFNWNGITLVPTFHPAFALRNPAVIDKIIDDFAKAIDIAKTGVVPQAKPVNYKVVRTTSDLYHLTVECGFSSRIAWDIETTGLDAFAEDAAVVCVQISTKPHTGWLLPFHHKERQEGKVEISIEDLTEWLRTVLEKPKPNVAGAALLPEGKPLVGQNLKFDMGYIKANLDINARTPAFDCYLAHHLLYEDESQFGGNGLKAMAWKFTDLGGYEEFCEKEFATSEKKFYEVMQTVPLEPVPGKDPRACLMHYACADVDVSLRVMDALAPKIQEEELEHVLTLELKKQDLLMIMEFNGAAIDWPYHSEMMKAFPAQLELIAEKLREFPEVQEAEKLYPTKRAKVKKKTGEELQKPTPFNANSPNQVRLLCYEVLKLPPNEKFITDKGEYSTRKEVVEGWLAFLPKKAVARSIVNYIVQGKRTSKLFGTYIKPLNTFKGRDGRIHTRYNQGRVVTGRLSSENPNLQQLPRDDEKLADGWVGKGNIKRLYVGGRPGWYVLEADYSQIELRIAALISQDPIMLANYERGEDLHARTASGVYKIPFPTLLKLLEAGDQEASRKRSASKIVNFGIIYGMQAGALSEKIGETKRKAQKMIDGYFDTYEQFGKWVQQTRQFAQRHGYVTGLFGHRRHLPNVYASDQGIREEALRQAVNFPIQNTASCLTAYAEGMIQNILEEDGFQSYCFGQVHDSVWLTGPMEERDQVAELVKFVMENTGFGFLEGEHPALSRTVPIIADVKVGTNLRDLKKL